MKFNRDCKSFLEGFACDVMTSENLEDCSNCRFYEPYSKKLLLIKLGALGDVIRTTPILPALKKKYGSNIHTTWLVNEGEGKDLLKYNPHIDKILEYTPEIPLRLKHEKFDILINLDIDAKATLIFNEVKAEEKYGYYFHEDGHPSCFNKKAEYYFNRVFSNHVNKANKKTYQEMMFEIAELPYNKEPIEIHNFDEKYLEKFKNENNIQEGDKLICINLGAGGRWPSKAWHKDNILELIGKLKDTNYKILLRAGHNETWLQSEIIKAVSKRGIDNVFRNRNALEISIAQNVALLSICDKVITGDTLVLHIATALKKKTLALFFCTPPQEIETYDLVTKLNSPLLEKYFYTDKYEENLVKSISADEVLKWINTS